jgi:hypothetical protein
MKWKPRIDEAKTPWPVVSLRQVPYSLHVCAGSIVVSSVHISMLVLK